MMTKTFISTVSKIYAKALLESVSDEDYSRVKKQLEEIIEVFNSSADLKIVMTNSSISLSKKLEVLDEVFSHGIDKKLLNFLKVLVEKNRFDELSAVYSAFCEMLDNLSNIKNVEIISPIPLNFENKTNVLFKLEHKLGCEIKPQWRVDKSVIAGLVFKFDDFVIDTSVRAKLENLSKNIVR